MNITSYYAVYLERYWQKVFSVIKDEIILLLIIFLICIYYSTLTFSFTENFGRFPYGKTDAKEKKTEEGKIKT